MVNTILTDDEIDDAWEQTTGSRIMPIDNLPFARATEAAVLAKLAAQEPIGWLHPSGGYLSDDYIKNYSTGLEREKHTIPVYAAPLPAVVQVPQGWKLVPVEPTEEMIQAANDGDDAYTLRGFGPNVQRVMQGPHDHYVAMLAAAPLPAVVQVPHQHQGDTALAVGNLIFALEQWKATTPTTAPPAWAKLLAACSEMVAAAAPEAPAQTYICTETMHTEIPCPKCKPLPAQPIPAPWREAVKVAREALEELHHAHTEKAQRMYDAALAQLDRLGGGE